MLRPGRSCVSRRASPHDFENRTGEPAGALNVFLPGGFEVMMPAIIDYFADRDAGDKR
jgi:hypothetical protein